MKTNKDITNKKKLVFYQFKYINLKLNKLDKNGKKYKPNRSNKKYAKPNRIPKDSNQKFRTQAG